MFRTGEVSFSGRLSIERCSLHYLHTKRGVERAVESVSAES